MHLFLLWNIKEPFEISWGKVGSFELTVQIILETRKQPSKKHSEHLTTASKPPKTQLQTVTRNIAEITQNKTTSRAPSNSLETIKKHHSEQLAKH